MTNNENVSKLLRDLEPALDEILKLTIAPAHRLFYLLEMSTFLTNVIVGVVEEKKDKDIIDLARSWLERTRRLFDDPPSSFVDFVVEFYAILEKAKTASTDVVDPRLPELLDALQRALHALVFTPPKDHISVEDISSDLRDFAAFVGELRRESDRGAALVGAAVLDSRLRRLLASHLVDGARSRSLVDDPVNSPLGSFSARILACYALGLITARERDECEVIRRVRNHFAHELHGLTFATSR